MDEMDFMDKQAKMLTEIVDVFDRNGANIFEMYRVLAIALKVTRSQVGDLIDTLDEQATAILSDLDGLLESE